MPKYEDPFRARSRKTRTVIKSEPIEAGTGSLFRCKVEPTATAISIVDGLEFSRDEKSIDLKRPIRRRYFMDAVVVPLRKRSIESQLKALEDEKKNREYLKPTIKKRENLAISLDIVHARFKSAGISLDPVLVERDDRLDDAARRPFFSRTYGGSIIKAFPEIASKKRRLGFDHFMYPSGKYQPHVPEMPGAPGLWFTTTDNNRHGEIKRVLTRIQIDPTLYQYQGQYLLESAQPFTPEEWARQKPLVRTTWAKALTSADWGIEMRITAYAKKHWGREPTAKERARIKKRELYLSIGETEMSLALTRGDVNMSIYTMRCVGYDAAFQRDIIKQLAKLRPENPKKPDGAAREGKAKGNIPNPTVGTVKVTSARKRRAQMPRRKIETTLPVQTYL